MCIVWEDDWKLDFLPIQSWAGFNNSRSGNKEQEACSVFADLSRFPNVLVTIIRCKGTLITYVFNQSHTQDPPNVFTYWQYSCMRIVYTYNVINQSAKDSMGRTFGNTLWSAHSDSPRKVRVCKLGPETCNNNYSEFEGQFGLHAIILESF